MNRDHVQMKRALRIYENMVKKSLERTGSNYLYQQGATFFLVWLNHVNFKVKCAQHGAILCWGDLVGHRNHVSERTKHADKIYVSLCGQPSLLETFEDKQLDDVARSQGNVEGIQILNPDSNFEPRALKLNMKLSLQGQAL